MKPLRSSKLRSIRKAIIEANNIVLMHDDCTRTWKKILRGGRPLRLRTLT